MGSADTLPNSRSSLKKTLPSERRNSGAIPDSGSFLVYEYIFKLSIPFEGENNMDTSKKHFVNELHVFVVE